MSVHLNHDQKHQLSTLFEDSAVLTELLEEINLIDVVTHRLKTLPASEQAIFVAGHPRIGEQSGLSALSAQEQASKATPIEVLLRLEMLNTEYENKYPGLRYITFVNGRSQAEIADEIEKKLSLTRDRVPTEQEWNAELARAVDAVGSIAKDRARKLGTPGSAF